MKMKKVIKAHKGMAHVPKPSGQQQAPSKAKGTAATAPRPKRMIGLPQQFKGGSRRSQNLPAWATRSGGRRAPIP